MNAPAGMRPMESLQADIDKHLASTAEPKSEEREYKCKKCGADILFTTCYVSIHIKGFSCAGMGEVQRLSLPFCPTCEGPPTKTSTCAHVANF